MSDAIDKVSDLPLNSPRHVLTKLLRLDEQNPRLVDPSIARGGDDAIVQSLYRSGELKELLQSIAANGYLDYEPLIVTLPEASESLVVLEGNRRLAALKLLIDPGYAEKLGIPTPEIDDDLERTLHQVRVIRVEDRNAARPFIAFKHINGPHRWDSYAKAKFAAAWYREERKQGEGQGALQSIANRIGDSHDTIKRMIAAIYVLEQAKKENLFEIEDRYHRKFNFSHLYTALSRSEYMRYLGLADRWRAFDPEPDPIEDDNLGRLKDVLLWIYGSASEDIEPVVKSQNPDIKSLGRVLSQAKAVHVLRATNSLEEAHGEAVPIVEKFSDALIQADEALRVAAGNLRAYDGKDESLLDIAANVRENSDLVYERMKSKSFDQSQDSEE